MLKSILEFYFEFLNIFLYECADAGKLADFSVLKEIHLPEKEQKEQNLLRKRRREEKLTED